MALTEFPAVSIKQRLRAARRLAAGDPLVLAAVYAGMTSEELERLQFDPDFTDLIDACRALHALDHAAWRARIELLMRDSVEDALQENRVSTLNTLLRGFGAVQGAPEEEEWLDEAADEPPPRRPFAEADPEREAGRQRLLARMGPELRGLFGGEPLDALAASFPQHARAAKPGRKKAAPAVTPESAGAVSAAAVAPLGEPEVAAATPEAEPAAAVLEVVPASAEVGEAPQAVGPALEAPVLSAAATSAAAPGRPAPRGEPWVRPGTREARDLLRARVDRLLDRAAERLPEEGDLADAVCAVMIPRWPYHGRVDLVDLQDVLAERRIDEATVAWLASDGFPFTRTLRGLARPRGLPRLAQGP